MLRVLSLAVFLSGVAGICMEQNEENLAKAFPQVPKKEQASLCCPTDGGCCSHKMAKETTKGKPLYDACEKTKKGTDSSGRPVKIVDCNGCAMTRGVVEITTIDDGPSWDGDGYENDEKEDKCAAQKEDEAEATKVRVMKDICTSMTSSKSCKAIKKGKTKLCNYNKNQCKPKKAKSKQMLNLGKKIVKPTKVSNPK